MKMISSFDIVGVNMKMVLVNDQSTGMMVVMDLKTVNNKRELKLRQEVQSVGDMKGLAIGASNNIYVGVHSGIRKYKLVKSKEGAPVQLEFK